MSITPQRFFFVIILFLLSITIFAVAGDLNDRPYIKWLSENALPFISDDPSLDSDDLSSLSDIVGSSRIVALGEATHGTAEFFRMKHRILKYLVEGEGFRVFLIEANMPESIAMNDYILYGEGSARQALAGMHFWVWQTQEVVDMVEWMREWNITHPDDPLYFFGFDVQYWFEGSKRTFAYLEDVDPDYAEIIEDDIFCLNTIVYVSLTEEDREACTDKLSAIASAYQASRNDYIAKSSKFEYLLHQQVLNSVLQYDVFERTFGDKLTTFNVRDHHMAEQAIDFAETLFPNERLVLWAHNIHISRTSFVAWEEPGSDDNVVVPMGAYLEDYFDEDYLAIAFAFGDGEFSAIDLSGQTNYEIIPQQVLPLLPNSHEEVLGTIDLPHYIIDIRVEEDSPAYTWLNDERNIRSIGASYDTSAEAEESAFPTALLDMYEVMIYFADTTASDVLVP